MEYLEIKNKESYNDLLLKHPHAQFLQSWEWGDVQKDLGADVFRYGFEKNKKNIFAWQYNRVNIVLGYGYYYAPRVDFGVLDTGQLNLLFTKLKKVAETDKILFLRFDPLSALPIGIDFDIVQSINIQPNVSLILDLNKSEEEIQRNMHHKTRYNIRLAMRKGVEVDKGGLEEFKIFWRLMQTTAKRDGFRLHNKEHYKRILDLKQVKLLIARYKKDVLAVGLFSFFGDTAVYMHGASANHHRNFMAPYLLQWEAIKIARSLQCLYYDFYGIDEKKWPGVTRFKKGFGGEQIEYPGTFDLVFNRGLYNTYIFARKLRRFI